VAIENNIARVLLLGGGYTLTKVAQRLPAGSFVITSRNEAQCIKWRKQGWNAFRVSVDDVDSIAAVFASYADIDILVDSVPPLRSEDEDLDKALRGVRNIANKLPQTKIKRLIYLSTTGVFGTRDGSWVDELTTPAPWNSQSLSRLESENIYAQIASQAGSRVEATALRLPAIYGADRGVAVSLRAGTYALVGDGSQWTNRIHVEDLADIIVKCINYTGSLPNVMCVNDDTPTQARDVVSFICERESLPWPRSVTAEEVLARGGYTMLSNQRVRNNLLKRVLGVELRYPSYKEGCSPLPPFLNPPKSA
jgi:nucleoside-diphosphate-sugar epimerase